MRILQIGDMHISYKFNLGPRSIGNCVFDLCKQISKLDEVDITVVTGDTYNSEAPTWRDMLLSRTLFGHLSSITKGIVYVIPGNHDIGVSFPSFTGLDLVSCYGVRNNIVIIYKPTVHDDILFIPHTYISDFTSEYINGLAKEYCGIPTIVAHGTTEGAITNNYKLGKAEDVYNKKTLSLFKADRFLFGHIHEAQTIPVGDTNVYYSGSIFQNNFAEPDLQYILIHDTDTGEVERHKINNEPFLVNTPVKEVTSKMEILAFSQQVFDSRAITKVNTVSPVKISVPVLDNNQLILNHRIIPDKASRKREIVKSCDVFTAMLDRVKDKSPSETLMKEIHLIVESIRNNT